MYLVVVLRPKDLEGDPVHQDRADPVGAQPGFAYWQAPLTSPFSRAVREVSSSPRA